MPRKIVGADTFSINNNTLLYIVDYYSRFSVMDRDDVLSVDDVIKATKIVFAKFGIPKKILSDADLNFPSDQFKLLQRQLNIGQAIT